MTAARHDRAITVDGARLTYTVAGDGDAPALCFIPGWCGHRSFFTAQIEHFARDRRVIAVDFPGFGDSMLPPDESIDAMTRASLLVRRVLAEEHVSDCWLIGHSAGGALALDVAAAHPGAARGVVGIDALTNPLFYPRQEEAVVDAIVAPLDANFAEATRAVAETWFIPGTDPAFKHRIIETTLAADAATATATLRAFLRWDMMQCLENYEGFVGAIVAADFHDASAASALLGDRVPVQLLAGVGHFLMMERPDRFQEALERFTSDR